jgi:hypothetical protein
MGSGPYKFWIWESIHLPRHTGAICNGMLWPYITAVNSLARVWRSQVG